MNNKYVDKIEDRDLRENVQTSTKQNKNTYKVWNNKFKMSYGI